MGSRNKSISDTKGHYIHVPSTQYADGHILPTATEGLMSMCIGKTGRAHMELDIPAELWQVQELPEGEGRKAGHASKEQ